MALGGSSARRPAAGRRPGHAGRRGRRVVGVVGALGATRLMSSLLFGVGAADAARRSPGQRLLLIVALAACVVPARRAVSAQPAAVLRNE